MPPLRDRREDIPLLAAHFLRLHAQRYRKPITGFDAEAHARAARPTAGPATCASSTTRSSAPC